jgi:hypothetical protein
MELLRFGVGCELRIRSKNEIIDGENIPTEVIFSVQPPGSLAKPYSKTRNEIDPIFLNRAERLKQMRHITVTITQEWFNRHLSTWKDEIIDMALQQAETNDTAASRDCL